MIKTRFVYLNCIALFLTLHTSVNAQSPLTILGKPYVSFELASFSENFKTKNPEISFLPTLKTYKEDHTEDGIALEYNAAMALSRVALYDSGFSYQQYSGAMPLGISWGMSLTEVQDKIGLGLDFTADNAFIRKHTTDDYEMSCYFSDGKLDHIKITASSATITQNIPNTVAATGIRLVPDGIKTEGNVMDGEGTMTWGSDVAKYKGEWSYGLPHGRGQYVDSFGNKYEGEFKLGFFWGQGTLSSPSAGFVYSGEFAMSKKHGNGRIEYRAKEVIYQGTWVQDIMHGVGNYAIGARYIYRGQVDKNTFTGKGRVETPDGYVDGYFKNGKPHGICTQGTKDKMTTLKGNFSNGMKDGVFDLESLGVTRKVVYKNGIEIKTGPDNGSLIPK
jgi:hypothetical protein